MNSTEEAPVSQIIPMDGKELSKRMQEAISKLDRYAKFSSFFIFTFFIVMAVVVIVTQWKATRRHRGHEYMLMPTSPVPAYMSVIRRSDELDISLT
ncbi:hypothetical protein FHG87_000670 [Trinorchestia longiramus]|nr:hypothetical protein FHG87_000670 [Trinorchestia longiramus]